MIPNRPTKILEISSYPPPRAGWGVRISFVREHLETAGHHCQVLNIGPSRKIKSADYVDVQSSIDYLTKVIWHARREYLIHTHLNGDSPKGLILALAAEFVSLLSRKRAVLTFHAGPVQRLFPKSRSRVFAPLFALAFALPQKIICNSPAVRENILTYGVPAEKVVPIPAFSQQYLSYTPTALPADFEDFLTQHKPILASYFFFRPEFFVESMLEAMRQCAAVLPSMGLVLIGGDTQSETVTHMVEKLGLTQHVYCAGDLPHDQFMTALSRSHVYVRTPQKDGVCSSVLEALSLKIPVVASENGSRPESVLTFRTNDVADLLEKLLYVWSNYDVVRSQVVPPVIRDTVKEEATLLATLARQQ
jgi:glycosyltransferase involved in cell wall biosynthesis